MRPFAGDELAESELHHDAARDRQHRSIVAFQDAEAELADEQNRRDQHRRQKAVIQAEETRRASARAGDCGGAGLLVVVVIGAPGAGVTGQRRVIRSFEPCRRASG